MKESLIVFQHLTAPGIKTHHIYEAPWLSSASRKKTHFMDRGSGQVASVLALNSDDPSSNPAGYKHFLLNKRK